MKLVPQKRHLARHLTDRLLMRSYLLRAPVRSIPLPVRIKKQGDEYLVVDGAGRTIGSIPSPGGAPKLGRDEGTLFLWRDN